MNNILKSTFAFKSIHLRSQTMEAHAEHLNQILSGSNKQIKMQKIDATKSEGSFHETHNDASLQVFAKKWTINDFMF
jgi:hypothetical protein